MKRATIRDVAKAAGVSITTVSKALNDYPDVNVETKKRIEEIVCELNYVPNAAGRSMGGITDPVIGLLISNLLPEDPSGSVYGFLSGMCHACKDNGIDFLLITTDPAAQEGISLKRLCLGKGLNGLVCCGLRLDDPYVRQLNDDEIDIPCVCIDVEISNPAIVNVTIDNVQAADEAVSFLIKNGRKNIALLHGSYEVDVSLRRIQGYRNAMERAGLPILPERLADGSFKELPAYQKACSLLKSDGEIDAFFCVSDLMALGACRAVEEAGLVVGRDIAVVGFDDIPTSRYLYGGLTTVRQDFFAMGYNAGCVVYEKVSNQPGKGGKSLLYQLVVRGSAPDGQ